MMISKYGINRRDFNALLLAQNDRCAICKEILTKVHIDHDHLTGMVRALLCPPCNMGLGFFKDDIRLLAYAIVYLEDHGKLSPFD